MRERGMPEEQILEELLRIKMTTWQILASVGKDISSEV